MKVTIEQRVDVAALAGEVIQTDRTPKLVRVGHAVRIIMQMRARNPDRAEIVALLEAMLLAPAASYEDSSALGMTTCRLTRISETLGLGIVRPGYEDLADDIAAYSEQAADEWRVLEDYRRQQKEARIRAALDIASVLSPAEVKRAEDYWGEELGA